MSTVNDAALVRYSMTQGQFSLFLCTVKLSRVWILPVTLLLHMSWSKISCLSDLLSPTVTCPVASMGTEISGPLTLSLQLGQTTLGPGSALLLPLLLIQISLELVTGLHVLAGLLI
jgi:hypothetical protein